MQKYSFLMSVYVKDNPEYLIQSIDSMINQTIRPDEIIIVEDGPLNSELYSILESYNLKFPGLFTLIQNEKNMGLGFSLNVGIAHARNEILARMDSDDISEINRCEMQLQEFDNNPSLDIVGTSTCAFFDDPNEIVSENHMPTTFEEIYERGKRHAPFAHVSVMYRKSTVEKYGGYGNYRRAQDADLFGRMLYGGCNCINIDKILVKVRKDRDISSRKKSKVNIDAILTIKKNQKKMGYISLFDYIYLWFKYRISSIIPNKIYHYIYISHYR